MRSIGPSVCSRRWRRLGHAGRARRPARRPVPAPARDLVRRAPRTDPGAFVQAEGPFRQLPSATLAGRGRRRDRARRPSYQLAIPWFGWLFALPTRRSLRRAPSHAAHGGRSRGGRRPSASTRGRPRCSGCSPRRRSPSASCNTLFTQTVDLRGRRVRRQRGRAGRGRHRRAARHRLRHRPARSSPIASGGGGCSSCAAFAAPVLCAAGCAGAVLRVADGHADARAPGRHRPRAARRRSWPSRRCRRDARAYAISVLALADGLGAGIVRRGRCPLADLGPAGLAADLRRRPRLPRRRRGTWPAACPRAGASRLPHAERAAAARAAASLLLAASAFLLQPAHRARVVLPEPLPEGRPRLLGDADRALHPRDQHARRARRGGRRPARRRPRPAARRGHRRWSAARSFTVISFSVAGPGAVGAPSWSAAIARRRRPSRPSASTAPSCSRPARRGGANGVISALLAWSGRASACSLAGLLLDQGVSLRPVMAVLAVGPLVVAALVVFAYPETAHLELERHQPRGPDQRRPRLRGRRLGPVTTSEAGQPGRRPARRCDGRRPSGRGGRPRSTRG